MSVSVSPATMAAICALLRALLLKARSWLARYLALWPARLGHCAFGLTPVTPWQPAQVADFALPAAASAAKAFAPTNNVAARAEAVTKMLNLIIG